MIKNIVHTKNYMKDISTSSSVMVYGQTKHTINQEFWADNFVPATPLYETTADVVSLVGERREFEAYTTLWFSRRNSNIYKNIFAPSDNVIDFTFLMEKMNTTITSANQIRQDNHGFTEHDIVFLDDDGVYRLSQADKPETARVSGMVTKVNTAHIFTLLSIGCVKWQREPFVDTTVLYLSDTEPGKLAHHTAIKSKILVPVAIYWNTNIILNIQQGSIGLNPHPYTKQLEVENFERYTIYEINEVIQAVNWGASNA